MIHHYTVSFEFIENGHRCHTTYANLAATGETEAVKVAREWYGFDKDGIEVTNVTVKQLD